MPTPRNKIVCLFSISQHYDQPNNNLVAFWREKPSIEILAQALGVTFPAATDNVTLAIVKIWGGEAQEIATDQFRLETVEEGELLE